MSEARARALPTLPAPVAAEGACCAACASSSEPPALVRPALVRPAPVRAAPVIRDGDRRITVGGIGLALAFLGMAGLALVFGPARPGPGWLPVHLALAGGAGTAIAAVLPFFARALRVAPPADARLRVAAIGLVASGAATVSLAVAAGLPSLAHIAGTAYVAGLVVVGCIVVGPSRGTALGRPWALVTRSSTAAIAAGVVSVLLAITYLSGWQPVVEAWGRLKPAHAWLNLVGFVSLVIVATATHLVPTIEGVRIRRRRSALLATTAVAAGAAIVASGYALASDPMARAGAGVALVGAVAFGWHARAVATDAPGWTAERDWHRLATWSLRAAAAWFAVAIAIMAVPVLRHGPDPTAWSLSAVAVPFVLGWVGQALAGSLVHLVPAIAAGPLEARAVWRTRLGRYATVRVLAAQVGIGLVWLGGASGLAVLVVVGAVSLALGTGVTLAIVVAMLATRPAPRRSVTAATGAS
jgi:nitrite reductase (NO-forming)